MGEVRWLAVLAVLWLIGAFVTGYVLDEWNAAFLFGIGGVITAVLSLHDRS
jgi:hypothetical protein